MSIRSLSCLCLLFITVPGNARADDAEDKAVAFFEKLGGKVTRDDKQPGKPVVGVKLLNSEVTDAAIKELAAFENLTYLGLCNTQVTDAGLKELATLKNLKTLGVDGPHMTDVGIKELQKALPNCKTTR